MQRQKQIDYKGQQTDQNQGKAPGPINGEQPSQEWVLGVCNAEKLRQYSIHAKIKYHPKGPRRFGTHSKTTLKILTMEIISSAACKVCGENTREKAANLLNVQESLKAQTSHRYAKKTKKTAQTTFQKYVFAFWMN